MTGEAPIFVRGLSRSGGTLMVTILDAHPDLAMSYELYPSLLEPDGSGMDMNMRRLARGIKGASNERLAANVPQTRGLKTFLT